MASPQKDDGFLILSVELYAGVVGTKALDGLRAVVLYEIWAQMYGVAKLPHATLSASEIAGRRGVHRSNIHHAITDLCKFGVIRRIADDVFAYVKDYEQHNYPGESEVQKTSRVAYAKHAIVLGRSHGLSDLKPAKPPRKPRLPVVETDNTHATDKQQCVVETDNGCCGNPQQNVVETHNELLWKPTTKSSPPYNPPSRSRELENLEAAAEGLAAAASEVSGCGNPPEAKPTTPPPPAKLANDPDEVKRLANLAEASWPWEGGPGKILAHAESYPAAWIADAIEKARTIGPRGKQWHYIAGVLRGYHRDGGPKPSTESQARTAASSNPLRNDGPPLPPPILAPVDPRTPEQKRADGIRAAAELRARMGMKPTPSHPHDGANP